MTCVATSTTAAVQLIIVVAFLYIFTISDAFFLTSKNALALHAVGSGYGYLLAKQDLYADDLFEDEYYEAKATPTPTRTATPIPTRNSPKSKYMNERWKLDPEDEKKFTGFPKENAPLPPQRSQHPQRFQHPFRSKLPIVPDDSTVHKEVEEYPAFSLMYKFKREYVDTEIESLMADHKGYCQKFKRLINSEEIRLGNARGVVLLWAGFTEMDAVETKAEIMTFMEDDPIITRDALERWDLIDLKKRKEKEQEKR